MQPQRALTKADRQRLIASSVGRKRIGTQFELLDALAEAGCHVTQATVSRDIRELGLEKVHDALGRPRYVVPQRGRRADPQEALRAMLEQFGRAATAAQNIVVLHCELGTAPAIGRALDEVGHADVVGTLAGDDTVLVIALTARKAARCADRLAGYGSGRMSVVSARIWALGGCSPCSPRRSNSSAERSSRT
jgi:transcriptional regulator of arginine metabolism